MKKNFLLFLITMFAFAISCTDKSLDPLKFDEIKKGTILALRGTQLDNVYNKGIPGAEVFPKIANGTEKFAFDGEYLSADPTSLSSVDVYAVQVSGTTRTRVLLTNVPFSQFKSDNTYPHPWVSISVDFKDILTKIGLDNTFPLLPTVISTLLTTYKFGIDIECDLNLKDGSKVSASDIVASGLFQSNQFYPAMRLNYAMTDYCAYDKTSWGLTYASQESGACCNSLEVNIFKVDPSDASGNTYIMDNWWGDGVPCSIIFSPSTNPSTQIVTIPSQAINDPGFSAAQNPVIAKGSGTYNQCLHTMTINCTYTTATGVQYAWVYVLTPQ